MGRVKGVRGDPDLKMFFFTLAVQQALIIVSFFPPSV